MLPGGGKGGGGTKCSITRQGQGHRARLGTKSPPRAVQRPLGAALRTNTMAVSPFPPPWLQTRAGCSRDMAALALAQGQPGLSGVTCLQLGQGCLSQTGEQLLKISSKAAPSQAQPCPGPTTGSGQHPDSSILLCHRPGARVGWIQADSSLSSQIPLHPPLTQMTPSPHL